MSCINQFVLPFQTDAAFCSGMLVMLHRDLTCEVKLHIAGQTGDAETADDCFLHLWALESTCQSQC